MASLATMRYADAPSLRRLEEYFIAPEIYKRPDVAVRQVDLARIVSNEIIPRLLHLHTTVVPDAPSVDQVVSALKPGAADIDALAHIVLGDDLEAAATYVTVLRDRGLTMEVLFTELLEPTARLFGTMWDEDRCDFIDVTLGVARLQKLLAIFNGTCDLPQLGSSRQVLMASAPGNQHSLGVTMIERLLSAAGWQVQIDLSGDAEEIIRLVRTSWFAVVGLAAGSDQQIDNLTKVIAQIREQSKNAMVGVMVGGPVFTHNPELAIAVGADGTARDAPTAVLVAQKLFDVGFQKTGT